MQPSLKFSENMIKSLSKDHSDIFSEKKELGKGSFGQVYEVSYKMDDSSKYAAKEEFCSFTALNQKSNLMKEKVILQSLRELEGFPRVENLIRDEKKEILIMTLLGPNLETLRNQCSGKMSLKSILMIGMQAIRRIESLHEKGFLHRDIKPANFVIGVGPTKNIIHMIDFGLSRTYLNKEKKHVKFTSKNTIEGTPNYLSVYGHLGLRPSRRDDLISLGFMLLYLYFGKMPWDDVKGDFDEIMQGICRKKATTSPKELCQGLPDEFVSYFDYVLKLLFQMKPDYNYLYGLFQKVLDSEGLKNDGIFEWDSSEKNEKGIDLKVKRVNFKPLSHYAKVLPKFNSEFD